MLRRLVQKSTKYFCLLENSSQRDRAHFLVDTSRLTEDLLSSLQQERERRHRDLLLSLPNILKRLSHNSQEVLPAVSGRTNPACLVAVGAGRRTAGTHCITHSTSTQCPVMIAMRRAEESLAGECH